jgi:hypothetical protein
MGVPGTGAWQLPEEVQTLGAGQFGGSDWPFGTWWHEPGGVPPAQVWQVALQTLLQQTPSTQKVDAHAEFTVHGWPFFSEQTPIALQVPKLPGRAQLWQGLLQEPLQQTPSTQKPLLHSTPLPQSAPSGFFRTQVPPPAPPSPGMPPSGPPPPPPMQ